MLNKAPRHTAIIICEDIRNEAGNKTTLCGIYSNGIIFQESDTVRIIPQLCIYGLFEPTHEGCEVTISIKSPSGGVVIEIPPMTISPNDDAVLCIGAKIQGINFKELGIHQVIFKFDTNEVTMSVPVSTSEIAPT